TIGIGLARLERPAEATDAAGWRARVRRLAGGEPALAEATGIDLTSDPTIPPALWQAGRTGRRTLAGKLSLPPALAGRPTSGFLLAVPIYAGGDVPRVEAERVQRLKGWVFSPFRAADFFRRVEAEEIGTRQL